MFCTCSCHTYYLRLVFLGVVDHAIKNAMFLNDYNYMINTACSFSNNQSFYCMVCCSTDPSVPPDSSVYNISTTRGTEVTVSLQGLTSGQMYYCKAAATNTNSNNCAGPVVGDVKVYLSFIAYPFPQPNMPTHGKHIFP